MIKEELKQRKIKTGIKKLDDLLKGGIPTGSNTMLIGPPFSGKKELTQIMVISMLQRGLPVIFVTFGEPAASILGDLANISPIVDAYLNIGRLYIIDAFSQQSGIEKTNQQGMFTFSLKLILREYLKPVTALSGTLRKEFHQFSC